jgi:hypothetical protein
MRSHNLHTPIWIGHFGIHSSIRRKLHGGTNLGSNLASQQERKSAINRTRRPPGGFWRNDPRLRYAGGRTNGVAVAPNKVSGTRSMSRKLLA